MASPHCGEASASLNDNLECKIRCKTWALGKKRPAPCALRPGAKCILRPFSRKMGAKLTSSVCYKKRAQNWFCALNFFDTPPPKRGRKIGVVHLLQKKGAKLILRPYTLDPPPNFFCRRRRRRRRRRRPVRYIDKKYRLSIYRHFWKISISHSYMRLKRRR